MYKQKYLYTLNQPVSPTSCICSNFNSIQNIKVHLEFTILHRYFLSRNANSVYGLCYGNPISPSIFGFVQGLISNRKSVANRCIRLKLRHTNTHSNAANSGKLLLLYSQSYPLSQHFRTLLTQFRWLGLKTLLRPIVQLYLQGVNYFRYCASIRAKYHRPLGAHEYHLWP